MRVENTPKPPKKPATKRLSRQDRGSDSPATCIAATSSIPGMSKKYRKAKLSTNIYASGPTPPTISLA